MAGCASGRARRPSDRFNSEIARFIHNPGEAGSILPSAPWLRLFWDCEAWSSHAGCVACRRTWRDGEFSGMVYLSDPSFPNALHSKPGGHPFAQPVTPSDPACSLEVQCRSCCSPCSSTRPGSPLLTRDLEFHLPIIPESPVLQTSWL